MKTAVRRLAWEAWLPIVLILVWWFASAGSTQFYFPPLADIWTAFQDNWLFEKVPTDLGPSLSRLGIGYAIAVVAGVVVGLLAGVFNWLEAMLSPIVEFFRAMPSVAMVPIMVLIFGLDTSMKVATLAFVGFFPIMLNALDGARSVDPLLRDVSAGYRLKFLDRMRFVFLPAAAPQIFAGARVALSMSIMAMALAEMVGTPGGVGHFVLDAQRSFKTSAMWSGILMFGVLGYVLNKAFLVLENRVLAWHRGMTAVQD